jgi:16S rRNA (guanine527-N7)-methyltransferase
VSPTIPWRGTGIMDTTAKTLVGSLARWNVKLNLGLAEAQVRQCTEHIGTMLEWNRRMNLTRIDDPQAILHKHLVDSLYPARWLPHSDPALDVGSGAGFPGIPLKILLPDRHWVLLEARQKKVSFLRCVIARLGLQNVRAVQGRWEMLASCRKELPGPSFGLITVRALRIDMKMVAFLANEWLRPEGVVAYWSGGESPLGRAWAAAPGSIPAGVIMTSHAYELPEGHGRRQLLLFQRM